MATKRTNDGDITNETKKPKVGLDGEVQTIAFIIIDEIPDWTSIAFFRGTDEQVALKVQQLEKTKKEDPVVAFFRGTDEQVALKVQQLEKAKKEDPVVVSTFWNFLGDGIAYLQDETGKEDEEVVTKLTHYFGENFKDMTPWTFIKTNSMINDGVLFNNAIPLTAIYRSFAFM